MIARTGRIDSSTLLDEVKKERVAGQGIGETRAGRLGCDRDAGHEGR